MLTFQAQLDHLVWIATTDIRTRKAYAWARAKELDALFPGISTALKNAMNGLDASTEFAGQTLVKQPQAGQKS